MSAINNMSIGDIMNRFNARLAKSGIDGERAAKARNIFLTSLANMQSEEQRRLPGNVPSPDIQQQAQRESVRSAEAAAAYQQQESDRQMREFAAVKQLSPELMEDRAAQKMGVSNAIGNVLGVLSQQAQQVPSKGPLSKALWTDPGTEGGVGRFVGDIGRSLTRGALSAGPGYAAQTAQFVGDVTGSDTLSAAGTAAQKLTETFAQAPGMRNLESDSLLRNIAMATAESVPNLAVQMAAGAAGTAALGPIGGYAAFTATAAGPVFASTYSEAMNRHGDVERAAEEAAGAAAVTAATSYLQGKLIGIGGAKKSVPVELTKKWTPYLKDAAKAYVKQFGTGGLSEAMQNEAEDIGARFFKQNVGGDETAWDDYVETMPIRLGSSFLAGGITDVPGAKTSKYTRNAQRAYDENYVAGYNKKFEVTKKIGELTKSPPSDPAEIQARLDEVSKAAKEAKEYEDRARQIFDGNPAVKPIGFDAKGNLRYLERMPATKPGAPGATTAAKPATTAPAAAVEPDDEGEAGAAATATPAPATPPSGGSAAPTIDERAEALEKKAADLASGANVSDGSISVATDDAGDPIAVSASDGIVGATPIVSSPLDASEGVKGGVRTTDSDDSVAMSQLNAMEFKIDAINSMSRSDDPEVQAGAMSAVATMLGTFDWRTWASISAKVKRMIAIARQDPTAMEGGLASLVQELQFLTNKTEVDGEIDVQRANMVAKAKAIASDVNTEPAARALALEQIARYGDGSSVLNTSTQRSAEGISASESVAQRIIGDVAPIGMIGELVGDTEGPDFVGGTAFESTMTSPDATVGPETESTVKAPTGEGVSFVPGGPLVNVGGKQLVVGDTTVDVIASPDNPSIGVITGIKGKDLASKMGGIVAALRAEGFTDVEYRADAEDGRSKARVRLFERLRKAVLSPAAAEPTLPEGMVGDRSAPEFEGTTPFESTMSVTTMPDVVAQEQPAAIQSQGVAESKTAAAADPRAKFFEWMDQFPESQEWNGWPTRNVNGVNISVSTQKRNHATGDIYKANESGDVVYIENIASTDVGKGQAREAMSAIIKKADELGVTLRLLPEASKVGSKFTTPKLIAWYKRLGFANFDNGGKYLERKPGSQTLSENAEANYESMSADELRKEAAKRGVDATGGKEKLIRTLKASDEQRKAGDKEPQPEPQMSAPQKAAANFLAGLTALVAGMTPGKASLLSFYLDQAKEAKSIDDMQDVVDLLEDFIADEDAREMVGEESSARVDGLIRRYLDESSGVEPETPKTTTQRPSIEHPVGKVAELANLLYDGSSDFKTINECRKFFGEHFGVDAVKPGTAEAKQVDEFVEQAVVLAARAIVRNGRLTNQSPIQVYERLVDLYERQPNLAVRTSESREKQAYSTPAPLAWLASQLAGIGRDTNVYEPTAGNGMLLIDANPTWTTANELNESRRQGLRDVGVARDPDGSDATEFVPSKQHDVLIANPPFGNLRVLRGPETGGKGVSKWWKGLFPFLYNTDQIDHAIVYNALQALKPGGRAVLIVGSVNTRRSSEERAKGYGNGSPKNVFYFNLYRNLKVVDHFTVTGDLYSRQGASFPVDVIVIENTQNPDPKGNPLGSTPYPWNEAPRVYSSWDDLKGMLSNEELRPDDGGFVVAFPGPDLGGGDAGGDKPGGPGDVPGGDADKTDKDVSGDEGPGGGRGPRPDRVPKPGPGGGAGKGKGKTSGAGGTRGGGRGGPRTDRPGDGEQPGDDSGDKRPDTGPVGGGGQPPKPGNAGLNSAEGQALIQKMRDMLKGKGPRLSPGANAPKANPALMIAGIKLVKMTVDAGSAKFADVAELLIDAIGAEIKPYLKAIYNATAESSPKYAAAMDPASVVQSHDLDAPKAKTQDKASTGQVAYRSKSASQSPSAEPFGILVPQNQAEAVSKALDTLEQKVGNLVEFTATKLGMDVAAVQKAFSAEQIDSIAQAIYQHENGNAFVIGDQTGIGKGRVVAGLLRYAHNNGMIPVFVTEKQSLYSDISRDLHAIGWSNAVLLPTNTRPSLTGEKEVILADGTRLQGTDDFAAAAREIEISHMGGNGMRAGDREYHVICTTYSQMNNTTAAGYTKDAKGNKIPDDGMRRRQGLMRLAPTAFFVFDESHNAGGTENLTEMSMVREAAGLPASAATFVRQLVDTASGVAYSSATWAKRPQTLDLYRRTSLRFAVNVASALSRILKKGGVAFQQIISSELAKIGEYMRRERSFDGVDVNNEVVASDKEHAEEVFRTFREINEFEHLRDDHIQNNPPSPDLPGHWAVHAATGDVAMDSTSFTGLMHHIVTQYLLATKSVAAVDSVLKSIQNGEKPVIALSNTMQSFLQEMVDSGVIERGRPITLTFGDLLERYAKKSRTLTFKVRGQPPVHHYLTDAELGPVALAKYNEIIGIIRSMPEANVPISPIDYIRSQLESQQVLGLDGKPRRIVTREITGRDIGIDYSGNQPRLYNRQSSDKNKGQIIEDFNNGTVDVLILNQSGSTGISLHSSTTVKDQRRRRMFLLQSDPNIDVVMQMFGRVHRTGQVVPPAYTLLFSDLPAENRPAAVLMKKMAMLNANVSSSRGGNMALNATDVMNKVGDMAVIALLRGNADLMTTLEINPDYVQRVEDQIRDDDADYAEKEGQLIAKVTGRLVLLPVADQEQAWSSLQEIYDDIIQQLDSSGQNPLEAKVRDFQAQTVYKKRDTARKPGNSYFSSESFLETVRIRGGSKTVTGQELLQDIATSNQVAANDDARSIIAEARKKHAAWIESVVDRQREKTRSDANAAKTPEAKDNIINRASLSVDRFRAFARAVAPGTVIRARMQDGTFGPWMVAVEVEAAGDVKNPASLSGWRVRFAIADNMNSTVRMTGSAFAVGNYESFAGDSKYGADAIVAEFDKVSSNPYETRYIVTGNLLASAEIGIASNAPWTAVFFTRDDGSQDVGLLMPSGFDPTAAEKRKRRIFSVAKNVVEFAERSSTANVKESAGEFTLFHNSKDGQFIFSVPTKKNISDRFVLNPDAVAYLNSIGKTFATAGGRYVVRLNSRTQAQRLVEVYMALGVQFEARPTTGTTELSPMDVALFNGLESAGTDTDDDADSGPMMSPATEERPARATRLDGTVQSDLDLLEADLGVRPSLSAPMTKTDREMDAFLKRIGARPVWISTNGAMEGAVIPGGSRGVVYLESGMSPDRAEVVPVHELVHYMKQTNPELYQSLVNLFGESRIADAADRYGARLVDAYGLYGPAFIRFQNSAAAQEEEGVAQLLEEMATSPELREFVKGKPALWARVRRWIMSVLDRTGMTNRNSALRRSVVSLLNEMENGGTRPPGGRPVAGRRARSRSAGPRFSVAPPVASKAFKKWFGKSRVVYRNGAPRVVYHGTRSAGFNVFSKDKLGEYTGANSAKQGFFFSSSPSVAASYPDGLHEVLSRDAATMPGFMGMPSSLEYRTPQAEADLDRAENIEVDTYYDEDEGGWLYKLSSYDQFGAPFSWTSREVYEQESDAFDAGEDERTQEIEAAAAKLQEMMDQAESERLDAMQGSGTYPVYLRITNPLEHDFDGGDYTSQSFTELIEEAKKYGHDGVIMYNVNDAALGYEQSTVYVVFEPTQIKSATGNVGTFDRKNPDIRYSPAKKRGLETSEIVKDTRTVAQILRSARPYMTASEFAKQTKRNAKKIVEIMKRLPTAMEMSAIAWAGRAKRGWYNNSAIAIHNVFGPDSPRFVALLAALSPRTSVELNLENALSMWANWVNAGRPTDSDAILRILARSVRGEGEESVLPTWKPNVLKALQSEEPENLVLSGPKVNSFMLNLRNVVNEVTNDAWMAAYALLNQKLFEGTGISLKTGDPGKGAGYIAMSARVRQAAKILTEQTGEEWTPAQVQETIWSWAKTLYEKAGVKKSAVEILNDGELTDELIRSTSDFSTLFANEQYASIIRKAGLQPERANAGATDQGQADQRYGTRSEAGPFDRDTQAAYEQQAARRLDRLRRIRQREKQREAEKKRREAEGGAEIRFSVSGRRQQQFVGDLQQQGASRNPFNDSELVFAKKDGSVVGVTFRPFQGSVYLQSIRSTQRNKGNASEVMRLIAKAADANGITLKLAAVPYSSGVAILSQKQLIEWYKKFGFTQDYRDSEDMTRKPASVGGPESRTDTPSAAGDIRFSVAPPARSQNFKKWFGKSQIVDKNGDPMVLYHVTASDFTEFKPGGRDPQLSGPAIWMTPDKYNQPAYHNYGDGRGGYREGSRVIPVYARIVKPLEITYQEELDEAKAKYDLNNAFPLLITQEDVDALAADGYDGVWYARLDGTADKRANLETGENIEVIAFNGNQVKSAIGNDGTYGLDANDIRFSPPLSPKASSTDAAPSIYKQPSETEIADIVDEYVAQEQRDGPERAMLKAQKALGGGVMSWMLEHVGDLTHRMTERVTYLRSYAGYEAVAEKVTKAIRYLESDYGWMKEHRENLVNNANYFRKNDGISSDEYARRVNEALAKYVSEHKKLPVFNRLQEHARSAAVAIAETRVSDALFHLKSLKKVLEMGQAEWARQARQFAVPADLEVTHPELAKKIRGMSTLSPGDIRFSPPSPSKTASGDMHEREYLAVGLRAALRAVRSGSLKGKKLKDILAAVVGEYKASTGKSIDAKIVRRVANVYLANLPADIGQAMDMLEERFNRDIAAIAKPKNKQQRRSAAEAIKAAVAELTAVPDNLVSEKEALAGKIRAMRDTADKVASEALRIIRAAHAQGKQAGAAAAKAQAAATLNRMQRMIEAMRLERDVSRRGLDEASRRIAKMEWQNSVREAVIKVAKEMPLRIQGMLIPAIRDAKSVNQIVKAINRAKVEIGKMQVRDNARIAARLAKKWNASLNDARKYEVLKAMRAVEAAWANVKALRVGKITSMIDDASAMAAESMAEDTRLAVATIKQAILEQRIEDGNFHIARGLMAKDLRDDMQKSLSGQKQLVVSGVRDERRKLGPVARLLQKYQNFRTATMRMDGKGRHGSGPFSQLFRMMKRAERMHLADNHAFIDESQRVVSKHGYRDYAEFLALLSGTLGTDMQKTVSIPLQTISGGVKTVRNVTLTLGQAVYMAASDDQTQHWAHRGAEFVLEADKSIQFTIPDTTWPILEDQINSVDPRAIPAMRDLKRLYDRQYFDRLNQVSKEMNGVYLEKVVDYWGVRRYRIDSEMEGSQAAQSFIPVLEAAGILMARTGGSYPIMIGDFARDLLNRSEAASQIVNKASLVRTVRATMLSMGTVQMIRNVYGDPFVDHLRSIVQDFAGKQRTYHWLGKIIGNIQRSLVAHNIRTFFRQLSTIPRLMAVMNPKDVMIGLARYMKHPMQSYRAIHANSPELRERWSGPAGNLSYAVPGATVQVHTDLGRSFIGMLRQLLAASRSASKLNYVEFRREIKSFSKPYNEFVNGIAIGNVFDAAAACVAYEARKARGASDKVAAQYATEIFEQVANTATTLESTELQAEARDNLLVATVMAFTSDVAKVQNLLMQAKMRGTLPRTISAIIASMLVSALVDYLFSLLTEKEPEDRQAIVVRRLASEAVGLLPGGVTVGAPLVDWMTQTTEYRPQILQTSLLDTMNKAYKAGTELIDAAEAYFVDEDAETGYDKLMAGLGDAADTAGSLAGLPVGIYRNLVQKSIERFD